MTREEAINTLKKSMKCHDRKVCGITEDCEECPLYADKDAEYEAHKVLLKCLKERDELLDKIRAEIEQKCCITVGRENDPAVTLYDIFQIIDKYKVGDKE